MRRLLTPLFIAFPIFMSACDGPQYDSDVTRADADVSAESVVTAGGGAPTPVTEADAPDAPATRIGTAVSASRIPPGPVCPLGGWADYEDGALVGHRCDAE